MIESVGKILCSSIRNLFEAQPDVLDHTFMTRMTEWNLGHHLSNEIHKYIFWLDNDLDVTKINYERRRPDAIFHKRNSNILNFLVVELKHRGADPAEDIRKITEDWMGDPLNYKFGASVQINNPHEFEAIVFHDAEERRFDQGSDHIALRDVSIDDQRYLAELVQRVYEITRDRNFTDNPANAEEVERLLAEHDRMFYELY